MKILAHSFAAILAGIILVSCNTEETVTTPDSNPGPALGKVTGPVITSISPTSVEIGDWLTVNGSGFGASKQHILIEGEAGTIFQAWTDTQIIVLVPSGAPSGPGQIVVKVGTKTSRAFNFTLSPCSPVTIGYQVWMGANLDVATYRNGDPIPQVKDSTAWRNATTGAWCYFLNDPAWGAIYGKIYNWYAVNDPRGLAPVGWHLPTDAEWKTLSMSLGMSAADADLYGHAYFGTDEGGKMKERGNSLWWPNSILATNSSGLTALPCPMRNGFTGSDFGTPGANQFWWTSSEYSSTHAWVKGLSYSSAGTYRNPLPKKHGFSVRCIRDN